MAAIAQRIRNLRTEPIAEPVSQLAPVAFVAFAVCLLIILGVREALEKYSLPYFHREGYSLQTDKDRRSFVQNYLHAIGRVIIIAFAVWPLGAILAGHGNWQTTYLGLVTYGDIELVAMQLTIALYFHDLLYRIKVSPVTLLHHVGAICVGAYAIIMCADYEDNLHAHAYFCIASIWGLFDILTESAVAVSLVIYRLNENRKIIRFKALSVSATIQAVSIIAETAFIFVVITNKILWEYWDASFKIATPILHCVFAMGQFWCAKNLAQMALKALRDSREGDATKRLEEGAGGHVEGGTGAEVDGGAGEKVSVASTETAVGTEGALTPRERGEDGFETVNLS